MNRADLQRLSLIRAKEAKVLLGNDCYDGSYYLIGYAVECALKACVARGTRRYDFPDRRVVNESYTHSLEKLIQVTGLQGDLALESRRDPQFGANWAVTKDWNEESRYREWSDPRRRTCTRPRQIGNTEY